MTFLARERLHLVGELHITTAEKYEGIKFYHLASVILYKLKQFFHKWCMTQISMLLC